MSLSLNLRRDLARLTDGELAFRLEGQLRAYDKAEALRKQLPGGDLPLQSWRGPVRHPRAYRAISFMMVKAYPGFYFGPSLFRILRPDYDVHLRSLEIRDLQDEIQRRLARKGRAKDSSQTSGA